ncbi:unnamed protein product [Staurois parvus]|uniref:Uncharacterized protein n=1 Tax=Staurois parvus TaxID=386267 RepID=A0ABN9D664_9NEOB|nr:unnamed protein product [Staurois parvus]
MHRLFRIRRSTSWMFTEMTAVGWEPPRPGSSLIDIQPFLKHAHNSNVFLQLNF